MSDTTVTPRRSARATSATLTVRSALAPWLGTALLAVVLGAALSGAMDRLVGTTPSLLLVAAVCCVATFLIFGAIGYPAFLVWPVVTGLAYPFVQVPVR